MTVSNLVWSLDGEALRAHNLKQLQDSGIAEDTIEQFLDNRAFSPTQQTMIVQAMAELKHVHGLEKPGYCREEIDDHEFRDIHQP